MPSDWDEWSILNEPILNSLIYFSKNIVGGTHELFFFLHSALTCFLFSCILKKFDNARVYLLTIGPMFLIDGITNGMRITLAYHFFAVAILYNKKILGGLVFLSHVTGLFMYMFKILLDSDKISIIKKVCLLLIIAVFAIILSKYIDQALMLAPRIATKLEKYSTMILPTKYSGIIDILMMVSVFSLAVWCHAKSKLNLLLGFLVALFLGGLFYTLVQNSLAFIRVGKLFIVALCLSRFVTEAPKKIHIYALLALGGIYSLNFLRQVILGNGFLPYPGTSL
jgi:hypothetical protein